MFGKEREVIHKATEVVKDSSQALMIVAGVAVAIATIALVVAVARSK